LKNSQKNILKIASVNTILLIGAKMKFYVLKLVAWLSKEVPYYDSSKRSEQNPKLFACQPVLIWIDFVSTFYNYVQVS
jgi:hypothetical protein